jgi:hypothetical protein
MVLQCCDTDVRCWGPKLRNFNASDEKVLDFIVENHKNGLSVTREVIQMKALEIVTFLKIQQ